MRLPLSWLSSELTKGKSPQELAEIFTLLGHEVEKIEEPAKNLDKVYVGKVLKVEKHPNADKLRIAETKIGSKTYKIVCGGSNLREGMNVAVALPGSCVRWHGEGELVELKETEIRGVKSVGMICASEEIGLGNLFPGKEREIIDLPRDLRDGVPLAKALMIDEPVLNLDITPNRPDCLSVIGLARELGASLGKAVGDSLSEALAKSKGLRQAQAINIVVNSKTLCPKYTAQLFTNVKVDESPLFIKSRLWLAGIRPINNVVDITNYVMLETGEPMHAFDFDKLSKSQIRPSSRDGSALGGKSEIRNQADIFVRNARKGESLKALDGNTYKLDETMLVIADAARPVAIAGVMGGEETGVTRETKNVLFEAAVFDPVSVRKTSRKLNLRSESSARFERGIAWPMPELTQDRARALVEQVANGKWQMANCVSAPAPKPVSISQKVSAINQMLNLHLTSAKVKSIFIALGFKYSGGENFRITPPWWRQDIKIPEDLYEEVGRIYGINKLSPTVPHGELKLAPKNPMRELNEAAKNVLVSLGFDEVYTYSFYGRDSLEKDGSSPEREPHVQVENPINPSQEFLRANLLRNLLDQASRNARIFDSVNIFETGRVFHHPEKSGGPAKEETHLAMISLRKGLTEEELFRKFKGDVLALVGKQVKASFRESKNGVDIYFDNNWVGWMGLLDESRKLSWKIKEPCAVCEFNLDAVLKLPFHPLKYAPISEFPSALRDIAFTVSEKIQYAEIEKALQGVDQLVRNIELFDIYRGKSLGEGKKSLALHVALQSKEKTLSDQEIDNVMSKLQNIAKQKLGAEIRV